MDTRRAASFKVVLLSQSFKFCDISEINENILFLISLSNARKISLSAIRVRNTHRRVCVSLRSLVVLSSRAHKRRSREIRARSARERAAKPREKLLPPQSPRGFSALARLYYLARPTKTAMLRRLRVCGHREQRANQR